MSKDLIYAAIIAAMRYTYCALVIFAELSVLELNETVELLQFINEYYSCSLRNRRLKVSNRV